MKILVLNYDDNKGGGVIWTFSDLLKSQGHDVCEIPYISYNNFYSHHFIDKHKKYSLSTIRFKLENIIFKIKNFVIKDRSSQLFFNASYHKMDAKMILNKCPFKPDMIWIGWYDFFLTPRIIRDLYNITDARILIYMIDEFLLGAGCHYPFNCNQYSTGCVNCPSLKKGFKWIASNFERNKISDLKDVPLIIAGTTYDLNCVKRISGLDNRKYIRSVGIPHIPFTIIKSEARKLFGIDNDDFCVLFGATNFNDDRKGLKVLLESLDVFLMNVTYKCGITILMLGNSNFDFSESKYNGKIKFIKTGYVSHDVMYKAYYACDIFVSPTLADSGPYMVNYSVACGRPVVAFPIGVALDLVIPGETGYLAKYGDPIDLAKGIDLFYKMDGKMIEQYNKNCLELINRLDLEIPWYMQALQ